MCKAPCIYWNYCFTIHFKNITKAFMCPLCTNIYTYACVHLYEWTQMEVYSSWHICLLPANTSESKLTSKNVYWFKNPTWKLLNMETGFLIAVMQRDGLILTFTYAQLTNSRIIPSFSQSGQLPRDAKSEGWCAWSTFQHSLCYIGC